MISTILRTRAAFILGALLALAALPAVADPVFGPELYTKVNPSGTPDVYTDTVSAPTAGIYMMWMLNGDDDGEQITSGSVAIGTTTIFGDLDLQRARLLQNKPIKLAAGANQLTVTLNAPDPGSFLMLLVTRLAEKPDFVAGRILLPYGDASANIVLDLKNGAHYYDRHVKLHFYDEAGALVATSDRFSMDPRASLTKAATDFITSGAWSKGSIEIFYAGRGGARLFGQATTAENGVSSIVPLQQAGSHRRDPRPRVP